MPRPLRYVHRILGLVDSNAAVWFQISSQPQGVAPHLITTSKLQQHCMASRALTSTSPYRGVRRYLRFPPEAYTRKARTSQRDSLPPSLCAPPLVAACGSCLIEGR